MVLMALDHANYFIAQQHSSGEYWGGAAPSFASTLSFLTRLVTHFCAPGFVLLMGVGMMLFAESRRTRRWSERKIIVHFLIRGSLLILLQLLLVNLSWQLGPFEFPPIYIGVLIALGGNMIITAFLLRFRPPSLLALALVLFIGTELLHPDPSMWNMLTADPVNLILLRSGGTATFWSNYPILPWLELTLLGAAFGQWLHKDQTSAHRRALWLGLTFLVGFLIVRSLNGFGNIRPRPGDDWIAFFNLVKYPPSMTFTLFTTGINLILLWCFSRLSTRAVERLKPLSILGQEPLFFYLIHLPIYAVLGRWLAPNGTPLGVMYLFWIVGLSIAFGLTLAYWRFKQREPGHPIFRYV
jgi:uncharacterized membrane protein